MNREGRSSVVAVEVSGSATPEISIVDLSSAGAGFAALLGFAVRLVVVRVVFPRFVVDRVLDAAFFAAIEFSPGLGTP